MVQYFDKVCRHFFSVQFNRLRKNSKIFLENGSNGRNQQSLPLAAEAKLSFGRKFFLEGTKIGLSIKGKLFSYAEQRPKRVFYIDMLR